jgi:NADH-quinone oxidoreductase subunit G
MVQIFIDGKAVEVEEGITIIQACEQAGVEIPRFCYHEKLSIAGNCRMCLVEMENSAKPVASCAMPVADGMKVKTNTEMVIKARKGVMEFLLINHPLDCPICDQGGECDLQDQAMAYGSGIGRYVEQKRAVKDKHLGPLIKTHMTRCIHCTRCIRFSEEIAGNDQLGTLNRGEDTEITSFLEKSIDSEMSANVIDLCPVGALTSKPYEYLARPWELKKTQSIDVFDAVGSNVRIDSKGDKILRVLPRINEDINDEWISDKTRFAYDGLNHQRIDRFYSRNADNKLTEDSADNVFNILKNKIINVSKNKIGSIVGNSLDCESIYAFKLFLDNLDAKNYECRQDDSYFIPNERSSYIFNSKISGIDESDLCILVGADIKKEAPVLSSRIRQRYVNFERTYPVFRLGIESKTIFKTIELGSKSSSLRKLNEKKNKDILLKSKKPIFILGQGAMCSKDAEGIFNFSLELHNKIASETSWNGFNILQNYSGRVGALDLGFYNKKYTSNKSIKDDIYNEKFEILFLLSADEIDFDKIPDKTFVVYFGHHGDRAVKRADLVIPISCFTEKEGIYINLEGRPQISRQVKLPLPAVDDFSVVLKKISNFVNINLGYSNPRELRELMFKNFNHIAKVNNITESKLPKERKIKNAFLNSEITSSLNNFYMTDSVSRNSPVMSECSMNFYKT